MSPQEREAFYEAEIAPALFAMAGRCEENGLSFLAVVEWEPGEQGRTISISPPAGLGIQLAYMAARSNGNADSLIMAMMKYATEHGHSSVCLKLLGVPTDQSADELSRGAGSAVELEVNAALGRVQTQTIGKVIQRVIDKATADGWRPIKTAPKDGTLLLLVVAQTQGESSSNPTEDELEYRTIGANNFEHDGDDIWKFAGWNWENDYWTEGRGDPIKWMPIPAPPHPTLIKTEG